MHLLFKSYLFGKHILVHDSCEKDENVFETLFALANLFNIRITSGQEFAEKSMIGIASKEIGIDVPKPFYRGFPQSVRTLSKDTLLFDQLLHYTITYGFDNFSEAGYSLFEEQFERAAFKEECEIKDFIILTEQEAVFKMGELVDDLLKSSRPISDVQYELVKTYIDQYQFDISYCENKDTAIRLLLETRDIKYASFITLADVMKVVERIQYESYKSDNVKKLNLKNQDRKLIKKLIDAKFTQADYSLTPYSNGVKECYERQALWVGLLHHIHYEPINELAEEFVKGIRSGKNISVLSAFEKAMMKKDVRSAVDALAKGKGSGAVLRKLNYILSRCKNKSDAKYVISHMETQNPIILIQLLIQYATYIEKGKRTFKFTKFNKLRIHEETMKEMNKRSSVVSEKMRDCVVEALTENLKKIYKNRLGNVYIDPLMKKMAVPLQENTSMGGFGTLPRGSRLPIPVEAGKKIRAFTYWEMVNDIDLSAFGISRDGRQIEFSWRNMWSRQSEAVSYSGDQTSGYYGGSEYFDIDLDKFKREYPNVEYIVFCNNVFSRSPFSECICRAGYMVRDIEDSGQVWEPKTVQSSFAINAESTFAYLFAIDLNNAEFIWLNTVRDSGIAVAGTTSMKFLMNYFELTNVFSVADLFSMQASKIVNNPKEADIVVTDQDVKVKKGAEVIRSIDFERILAYMNV